MSKGDTPRPVNKKKYDANYERVFGKRAIKTWTDAPGVGKRTGADSGSDNKLPEASGRQSDPKTTEIMEGERL